MRLLVTCLVLLGLVAPAIADDSRLKIASDQVLDPDGTVTASEIDTAFAASSVMTAARRCTGAGELLAWVVFQNGKVIRAEAASSNDRGLEACVTKAVRTAVIASKARIVATLRITVFARVLGPGDPKVMSKVVDKVMSKIVDTDLAANLGKFEGVGTGAGVGTGTGTGVGTGTATGAGPNQPKLVFTGASGELGGFSGDEIDRVIKSRAGVFRACYERELTRSPGIAGKLVVTMEIAADGTVGAASVASSTVGSDALNTCLITNVKRLKFPPKGKAVVHYPLLFSNR